MRQIDYASHTALISEADGEGVLILPRPGTDLAPLAVSGPSLHAADWDATIRHLAGLGWSPVGAEGDDPSVMGALLVATLSDGRECIALAVD